MAVVPYANSPHHISDIVDDYLLGIQAGDTQGDAGRAEMKHVTALQLRQYITKYFGSIFNYRGDFSSATPDTPAVNDLFLCTADFTEGTDSYEEGEFYAYSLEEVWERVTEGIKGPTGDAAGFGTPTATVDATVGTPSVTVTASGPDTAKIFAFSFHNLKGVKGDTGEPFAIYRTYTSIAEMNADFDNVPEGKFVIIASTVSDPDNAKLYVRGASAFTFITDLSGAQGIQGPTGNGISSITVYYAVTSTQTTPDASDITSASIPSMSSTDKYLWQKMVILYTSGSSETIIDLVGVYGDKGDTGNTGATGNGISSIAYKYAVTSTQVAPLPENITSDSIPAMSNTDKYLWAKQTINFTSGSPTVTVYLLSIYGDKGDTGATGAATTISATSVQYQASASGTTVPTGTWLDSPPTVPQGQFLWTRTVVTYSPSGSTTSYSVSYQGEDGTDVGLPSGGTAGQYLKKKSATDYDSEWSSDLPDRLGALDWQEEAPPQDISEEMEQLKEDVEQTVTQAVGNMQYGIIAPETIESLRVVSAPSSSSDSGMQGDVSFDTGYFYICISDGVWKRAVLTDF